MSRKALLVTFGTLGDLYPFISIALALKARGFDVTIAAPEMHRVPIEAEGIAHAFMRPHESDIADALGVDIPGAFKLMLKNPYFILDDIYLRFLAETYEDVLRACEGADLVIAHSLLVGAHQAVETCGLPRARVALAPLHLQSAMAPSLTPPAPYVLRSARPIAVPFNRIVRAVIRALVNARMGRLRTFRKKVGLPPTREDFFLDFGRANKADVVFGLYSPHFAPPQADQPKNLRVPGFPFYTPIDTARRDLEPKLRAFLSAGEAPIVFTLGSFAPEVAGDFYVQSLRAARKIGRRAILLAGTKEITRLASIVRPGEHVCEQAPHGLLFPHALVIVHHGGIGTTAEALRAGKPQIIVPFFGDQPDHGARIERLGVGLSLKLSDYDAARAAAALRKVLEEDCNRQASRFARHIETDTGVSDVADWADGVLTRRQA